MAYSPEFKPWHYRVYRGRLSGRWQIERGRNGYYGESYVAQFPTWREAWDRACEMAAS